MKPVAKWETVTIFPNENELHFTFPMLEYHCHRDADDFPPSVAVPQLAEGLFLVPLKRWTVRMEQWENVPL